MKRIMMVCLVGASLTFGCGGDDEDGSGGGGGSTMSPKVDEINALTGDAMAGMSTYNTTCANGSCHGPDGNNGAPNAGDLPNVIPGYDKKALISVIVDGFETMLPQSQLQNQEVANVVAHVKERWQ